MRPIERIDNFLDKINWNRLCEKWEINMNENELRKILIPYWKNNPDQRVGQALINLGIAPNSLQIWALEEEDILISQGVSPEECVYWTSIYDKEENLLEIPKTNLIKNLEKGHILNIKKFFEGKNHSISSNVLKAFENMLNK